MFEIQLLYIFQEQKIYKKGNIHNFIKPSLETKVQFGYWNGFKNIVNNVNHL